MTTVHYKNRAVSGVEQIDEVSNNDHGKGFYNEFGIEDPVGFEETEIGGWFHKIGVGLLKKTDNEYGFYKSYEIKPAAFKIKKNFGSLEITCISEHVNGYGYLLRKTIGLTNTGFVISYELDNTGIKPIITDEYNHNFLSLDHELVGKHYVLKFPFDLDTSRFKENVNDEGKVMINKRDIEFSGTPKDPFFFSDLTGSESLKAAWELVNLEKKLGMQETVSFKTNKVNLWGWGHVISPELFFKIYVKPGESLTWSRTYSMYDIK